MHPILPSWGYPPGCVAGTTESMRLQFAEFSDERQAGRRAQSLAARPPKPERRSSNEAQVCARLMTRRMCCAATKICALGVNEFAFPRCFEQCLHCVERVPDCAVKCVVNCAVTPQPSSVRVVSGSSRVARFIWEIEKQLRQKKSLGLRASGASFQWLT